MNLKKLILLVTIVVMAWSAALAQTGYQHGKPGEEPGEWTVPDCDHITGSPMLTFTTDEGVTIAQTGFLKGLVYTYGLVALDEGNTLLAATMTLTGTSILKSVDAGCSWHQVANLPESDLLLLTAAPRGRAYGWSRRRDAFYRIDDDVVTSLVAPNDILGLAVDPENADHIRIGTYDCQLYESFDGGASFSYLGGPANSGSSTFYTVEFDPSDPDCALCGGKGAWRTTDAGATWSNIEPFDLEDVDMVYLLEFSKSDPNRVWARSNLETISESIRCILTSDDGGQTFVKVLEQGAQALDQNDTVRTLVLTNQPTMAANPEQSGVLYVAWGSYFQGVGTSLFRYNVLDSSLTVAHINGLDGIDAIAFNPADASVMYLGLEAEGTSLAKAVPDEPAPQKIVASVSPNPFNPTANITFSLPQASRVKLDIYNIKGQRVSTLVDSYLSAGEHTFTWDGSRAASGIYLYRLQTDNSVDSKKMLLVK